MFHVIKRRIMYLYSKLGKKQQGKFPRKKTQKKHLRNFPQLKDKSVGDLSNIFIKIL